MSPHLSTPGLMVGIPAVLNGYVGLVVKALAPCHKGCRFKSPPNIVINPCIVFKLVYLLVSLHHSALFNCSLSIINILTIYCIALQFTLLNSESQCITVQCITVQYNFLIYQARESTLVPPGFLIAQFLQKMQVYEAFVLIVVLGTGNQELGNRNQELGTKSQELGTRMGIL